MSRIGSKPIKIPAGVTIEVNGTEVVVKGPKGELKQTIVSGITIKQEEGMLVFTRKNDQKQTKAYHGLVRSLLNNMLEGVSQGYKKTLDLVGTGYRATKKGQGLSLAVGFSHTVEFTPLAGVLLELEGNNVIHVSGIDKQAVGQVAANIRAIRPPEPYQGKGIKYRDEVVRRKAGKTAKTA
ncbi:MAG: 50S ribosomal protein L6 [Patescibacteria group bacterium]